MLGLAIIGSLVEHLRVWVLPAFASCCEKCREWRMGNRTIHMEEVRPASSSKREHLKVEDVSEVPVAENDAFYARILKKN